MSSEHRLTQHGLRVGGGGFTVETPGALRGVEAHEWSEKGLNVGRTRGQASGGSLGKPAWRGGLRRCRQRMREQDDGTLGAEAEAAPGGGHHWVMGQCLGCRASKRAGGRGVDRALSPPGRC